MMEDHSLPTRELLLKSFEYREGTLFWKDRRHVRPQQNSARKGKRAGSINTSGYVVIGLGRKVYKAHRIIYKMFTGLEPPMIDHVDMCRTNNKIENLRPCTRSQNLQNSKTRKDNSSGRKGVHWSAHCNKWIARISSNGKRHHLGCFDSIEEAVSARTTAEKTYHKEFRPKD